MLVEPRRCLENHTYKSTLSPMPFNQKESFLQDNMGRWRNSKLFYEIINYVVVRPIAQSAYQERR